MLRKSTALFLALVMILSLLPAVSVPAAALEEQTPEILSTYCYDWQGISPAAGDEVFYVQCQGHNLTGLDAVVCTKNSGTYTQVASQTEKRLLGKNIDGSELVVYKMKMDGENQTLAAGSYYYVRLRDSQDNYYDKDNYFNVYSQPYYPCLNPEQPAEISSDTGTIHLRVYAYGYAGSLVGSDFKVELVQAGGIGWDSDGDGQEEVQGSPVVKGTMDSVYACLSEGGAYLLEGDVVMQAGSLSAGDLLFARVTAQSAHSESDFIKYSMSPIRVLDGAGVSIGQFQILNSVMCQNSWEGMEHGSGGAYFAADGSTDFACGAADTELYFELTGTNITAPEKLTATLGGAAVSLSDLSVQGPECGVYSLSGKISAQASDAGALVFYYDGAGLYETRLNRLSGEGDYGVTVSPTVGDYGRLPAVPKDASFDAYLGYPMNLTLGQDKFTAWLKDGATDETIQLGVTEHVSKGCLSLTLTTPVGLTGTYGLYMQYDGSDLQLCSYTPPYDETPGQMYYCAFQQDTLQVGVRADGAYFSSVENDGGSLILYGGGFSASSTYTAQLIPRGGASLTPTEISVGAQYESPNSLTIAQASLNAAPAGWYTVYLKQDGVQINGFTDTSLLPVPGALTPPSALIETELTTGRTVSLKVSLGSYLRVKIAESLDGLSSAAWQATAPSSFTLSEGYGVKTLYFLFEAEDGSTVTLSDSVKYRSAEVAPFASFGAAGAVSDEGGTYRLNEGISYTLYFTHTDPGLSGTVEFKDADGNVITTEILRRTSGGESPYTYSKTVQLSTLHQNVVLLSFCASDADSYEAPVAELPVAVSKEAEIRAVNTSYSIAYTYSARYVLNGSTVSCYLTGTPGYTGTATLNYETADGSATKQYTLSELPAGVYKATAQLPGDAVAITGMNYTLTEPGNDSNSASRSEPCGLTVAAGAVFTGLDNTAGAYNGMTFSLYSSEPWHYKSFDISGNQTDFTFSDLIPDAQYEYMIEKNGVIYASDTVSAGAGQRAAVSLSGAKTPASLTFALSGGTLDPWAYIQCSYQQGDYTNHNYATPTGTVQGLYIGQEIEYTLSLSYKDLKTYRMPDPQTVTITGQNQTETIALTKLPVGTVSGTVSDKYDSSRVIEGVSVSATQCVTNGSSTFYHSASTVTDENGDYTLSLYLDAQATLNYSCKGYEVQEKSFTPAENALTCDAGLAYSTTNKIKVTLYVLPLDDGSGADLSPVVSDASQIYLKGASGNTGTVWYSPYFSSVTLLADVKDNAGKTIDLDFASSSLVIPDTCQVQLDPYANGSAEVTALQYGMISAKVASSGDNPPTAYMLLFNPDGTRATDVISAPDRLSTKGTKLAEGTYTVILLRGYDLTRVSNFRTLAQFTSLALPENTYYVKKTATVTNGCLTDLGEFDIPETVNDNLLGAFDVRFDTEYIPGSGNGQARVLVHISPSDVRWDRTITLTNIYWGSDWNYEIKSGSYVDGVKTLGTSVSYYTPEQSSVLDHTLLYSILPSDKQQSVTASVAIIYTLDGQIFRETYCEDIPVSRITLSAPTQVKQGSNARQVYLDGLAPAGATVEIYEEDQLIGSAVADRKNSYCLQVSLTCPDQPGFRTLTAKMEYGGTVYTSEEQSVEVLNKSVSAYADHILFLHYPHAMWGDFKLKTEFYLDDPDSPDYSSARYYNPNQETIITFRINNLLKDQIETASIIKTYRGGETVFAAQWVKDVTGADASYSEWTYTGVLGYIDDIYVLYTLKSLSDLSAFTGTTTADFSEAAAAQADPAQVPSAIRNGSGKTESGNMSDEYQMSMQLEGGGTLSYSADFESVNMTAAELESSGCRRVDTAQGSYWVYESVVTSAGTGGTVNCSLVRRVYFDSTLTDIINPPSERRVASPKTVAGSSVDAALSCIDMTGNLQNAGEIVYEGMKGAPANLGRFGTSMNVVGGVALAVNIFRGRTTKDAQTLYDVLNLVNDGKAKDALRKEIQDYSGLTVSHYTISNVFNGVGYIAGYAGPLGKGLSIISSLGGGYYNDSTSSELNSMWDSILRSILAELELQDLRAAKKEKQKKVKWYLDPSGYVYEAVESNRVDGIEASVYSAESADGVFSFWSEASDSNQKNPQASDADGRYGWDVPQGFWKVLFSGAGYLPAESKAMEVDPVHDKVNIGLLSTRAPAISAAALNAGGLEIEFDTFMQAESVYDKDTGVMNVRVVDSAGNPIPLASVEFVIAAENTGYDADMTYQKDVIYSDTFVKRIRLIPDQAAYPGGFRAFKDDGVTPETYTAAVGANVLSYAGVNPAGELATDALTVSERTAAAAPQANVSAGSYALPQSVTLSTATAGASIYYTTDGTDPTTLSRVYGSTPIAIEKTCVLKLIASKAGMDDSEVAEVRYYIGPDAPSVVSAPTASPVPGTYGSAQQVTLSCATEGASIYYTTDGTRPDTGSTLYTGPVAVSQSLTIKAVAVKTGFADSGVASFAYVVQAADTGGTAGPGTGAAGPADTAQDIKITKPDGTVSTVAGTVTKTDTMVKVELAGDSFGSAAETKSSVTINAELSKITFDAAAVTHIGSSAGSGTIGVSVETVDKNTLSTDVQAAIGNRPVYDFSVTADGTLVSDFGGGTAAVSIPYTLAAGEDANAVVVYYIDDNGTLQTIRGAYRADTGTVDFTLTHFSRYAVGYNKVTFPDVNAGAWYSEAVTFIAARGITNGTPDGTFDPGGALTRGQFMVMLMRAYGIEAAEGATDNFSDAGNTYYTPYLAAAKRLGIAAGVGNNQFAPDNGITRQEMFTLLYRALGVLGELPAAVSDAHLADFTDGGETAAWASDALDALIKGGIVKGSAGALMPGGTATRAEMAQMMYNLLSE